MPQPPAEEPKTVKSGDSNLATPEETRTFKTPHPTPETPESRDLKEHGKTKNEGGQVKGSGASPEDVEDNRNRHVEKQLDHGLKETFPASDPVSINPGAD